MTGPVQLTEGIPYVEENDLDFGGGYSGIRFGGGMHDVDRLLFRDWVAQILLNSTSATSWHAVSRRSGPGCALDSIHYSQEESVYLEQVTNQTRCRNSI